MRSLLARLDAVLPFNKTERIIIGIVLLLHALPALELLHWHASAPKTDDERVMANLVSPEAAKQSQQSPATPTSPQS